MMSGCLLTILLICFSPIQEMQKPVESIKISGEWRNVKKEPMGITRIEISDEENTIQVFVHCYPQECKWGMTSILKYEKSYKAIYENRASKRILEIRLLSQDKMRLTEKIIYPSKSPQFFEYKLTKI